MNDQIPTVDCSKYKSANHIATELLLGRIKTPTWLKFEADGYMVTPENMRAFVNGISLATDFDLRKQIEQV